MRKLEVVDLFCGAGGTSSGILEAVGKRPIRLTAVNHWKTAINTHSLNHPGVHHICEPVENIHPLDLVKSGHLDLLAASCECRFHSNARGGGVCNEQSRSQAWQLIRWMTDLQVDNLLMENVREFKNWGPIHPRTKRPIKSRAGEFFKAFILAVESLGYKVEWRIQSAADFGDATSRKRLILMACKGRPVPWPAESHGPQRGKPWRTARQIIDWKLKGKSIFDRKNPLCDNTLARMAAGLKKFGEVNAEPFLVMLNGTTKTHIEASARSVDEPLPTVTCSHHIKLVEPFLMKYHGNHAGRSDGDKRNKSVDEPLPTQDTSNRLCLVEPFIQHLTHHGEHSTRCHSVDEPLPTVTGAHRGEMALVEPFIVQTDHTGGNGACIHGLDKPLPTVVTKQNMLVVEPLVLKYYKTGRCKPVDAPLDTITTKARVMLVECHSGREVAEIDIRTRMLQPHELGAAHSFSKQYVFTGNKEDQTKQIGNSVPVKLARAHARVLLSAPV